MDRLARRVLHFIRWWKLLKPGDDVVVGFSGGPDSVALALILLELGESGNLLLNLHLAHLNHRLRGEESDSEEEFCRGFAQQRGLDLLVEEVDVATEARQRGTSVEATARDVRYDFLGRAAKAKGAPAVATAHHADDVAETVLLRLIRGAGVTGLGAMAPQRQLSRHRCEVRLVRPLLGTRKADLVAFLHATGQPFCTDSSNLDPGYTRNRIRHKLIPMLEREFPSFSVESLCALNESAIAVRRLCQKLLDGLWDDLCRGASQQEVLFDSDAFASAAPPLRKAAAARALEKLAGPEPAPALRAQHHNELSALAEREVGVEVSLPRGYFARREHGLIYFSRRRPTESLAERELAVPGSVELAEIGISLSSEILPAGTMGPHEAAERASGSEVYLSPDAAPPPLKVRSRRPGDRFQPLGADAPTRLKRFFIGRRVPLHERDQVPLVLTGEGEIVWVVGHEIAERCKLTGADRPVLRLRAERLPAGGGS